MNLESIEKLKKNNISYRLIELKGRAISAGDVIKYSKEGEINPEEICKTIIIEGKKSGNKYALFVRGNDKIDFSKIKRILNEETKIVDFDTVKEVAETEPGAVCPLILSVPVYIDKNVFDLNKINFGSGSHLYGLEINSKDLNKVINYKIESFVK